MEVVSDLHLHSKYSRAVSQNMTLPVMADFARKKGLNLLTTGDWTHPMWLREIKSNLVESGDGVYSLKDSANNKDPKFVLSVEVSSIYSQGGKTRRIHCLLFAPDIPAAEKFGQALTKKGANLNSDGRPIVGLTPPQLLEMLLGIDDRSFLIPCHVWTPWFSLYGSMSGFDSIDECFGEMSKYIYGIETGLSSDPAMNWRIVELEKRSILSFSDSHSPIKMGRESTVFELESLSFANLKSAIMRKGKNRVAYTIEFYPEEGKYHYTGHRNCKVIYSPEDTRKKGTKCPVCGRPLTVGVMEQVEKLAAGEKKTESQSGKSGLKWIMDPAKNHPPFAKMVPLNEIIAECLSVAPASLKVKALYDQMTNSLGSEFDILLKLPIDSIEKNAGEKIANAILKVRNGGVFISPGYDGEFGIVKIDDDSAEVSEKQKEKQLGLI